MNNTVYKYLPKARRTYFENELLRITQPIDLNDPFECLPRYVTIEEIIFIFKNALEKNIDKINNSSLSPDEKNNLIENLISKIDNEILRIKNNNEDNYLRTFFKKNAEHINSSIGILSLSERWDNPLMWAHYTDSHKGFCVGFDSNSDFFQKNNNHENDLKKWFVPVKYDNNRAEIPTESGYFISYDVLFTKSPDWEYEKEVRLLLLLEYAEKKFPGNPYDIFLYRVPHKIIKEVLVGINTSEQDLVTIKEFCIGKNIPLFKCKISDFKFQVERFQI